MLRRTQRKSISPTYSGYQTLISNRWLQSQGVIELNFADQSGQKADTSVEVVAKELSTMSDKELLDFIRERFQDMYSE